MYAPNNSSASEQYTSVKLIPEQNFITPDSQITVAIEITLAPDWHVYWENPGDSGLPAMIEWEAPEGFEFSDISWPVPSKISYGILSSYGYYDKVMLLQTLKIPETLPKGTITLNTAIDMLVCNEICIPEKHRISIELNNAGDPNIDNSEYIKSAQSKLPKEIEGDFKYFEENNILNISLKLQDISILDGVSKDDISFFPIDWDVINNVAEPSVKIENNQITISHERGGKDLTKVSSLPGLLIIKEGERSNKGFFVAAQQVESLLKAEPLSLPKEDKRYGSLNKITWLSAILFAVLGGLILNLMPCVFPILSMKALSLVKMNEKENKMARLHGIAYTLGVVLSFIAVGVILMILKEAGTVIGWGFQLQNPVVIAVLAYLLFAIGLNLIGFFEFGFGLNGNIGNKLTQGKSLSSSFFTGTLATIVATPCTAPFMGVAMGFALIQPPLIGISVFAALGFGLALPYLILSCVPYFRKALPKPGAWMNIFRQFLAFPMFASSIWLIWVLSQQSGSYGVLLVLLGMLAIAFCVWLSHLKSRGTAKNLTTMLLALFLLLPFFSLFYIKTTIEEKEHIYSFGMQFSQEKLSELLLKDDPVFVEMTAAWCITCKANHALAIDIESTRQLFKEQNVQYLIGDWTNKDDKITEYLSKFGRNGVPLYIFYPKRDKQTGKRPDPIVLPQILTPAIIDKIIGK